MRARQGLAFLILAGVPAAQGLEGGGPLYEGATGDCVSPERWAQLVERSAGLLSHAPPPGAALDGPATPYPTLPVAGNCFEDLFAINFVDLDPGPGALDWSCSSNYTYDGHTGDDWLIRTFDEQAVGVPVFAALDGIVFDTDDGHFDMVTSPTGTELSNYVAINHGSGRLCYYHHLKNGSVAVSIGDTVQAGQQIGMVGSSGTSDYPHLHLLTRINGSVYEPYAGPCNPGPSGWVRQDPKDPLDTSTFLMDFAFSRQPLGSTAPPYSMPRTGQTELTDAAVYWWLILPNLPAGSTWRYDLVEPGGTIAYASSTGTFGNASFVRWSWWKWSNNAIRFFPVAGTWKLRLFVNGSLLVEAPLEAVVSASPGPLFAPEPIGLQLSPTSPRATDPIRCSVVGDPILDDRDYDVVQYRYQWRVDGLLVRDVTSAARADVLPARPAGSRVSCAVTPSDGTLSGQPAMASVRVLGNGRAAKRATESPEPVTF